MTVNTPVEGGTFAFGDDIPYTVTVTDPEDGAIDCSKVIVTFVLGHDSTVTPRSGTTGCTGVLHTLAGDVSHGGNVFGIVSATYTDKGGVGGTPPLTTIAQHNIRQKHHEVEFAVNQSGTNTGNDTDHVRCPVHRGSLAAGDWIQLNGPMNLANITSISYRVADAAAAAPRAPRWRRSRSVRTSTTGPILQTNNLVSTGASTPGRTRRSRSARRARTGCSWCSAPSPTVRPEATCSTSTTRSSRAPASPGSSRPTLHSSASKGVARAAPFGVGQGVKTARRQLSSCP